MAKRIFLAVLLIVTSAYAQSSRKVNGIIYFTNNTPGDVGNFPVEGLRAESEEDHCHDHAGRASSIQLRRYRAGQVSVEINVAATLRAMVQIGPKQTSSD